MDRGKGHVQVALFVQYTTKLDCLDPTVVGARLCRPKEKLYPDEVISDRDLDAQNYPCVCCVIFCNLVELLCVVQCLQYRAVWLSHNAADT